MFKQRPLAAVLLSSTALLLFVLVTAALAQRTDQNQQTRQDRDQTPRTQAPATPRPGAAQQDRTTARPRVDQDDDEDDATRPTPGVTTRRPDDATRRTDDTQRQPAQPGRTTARPRADQDDDEDDATRPTPRVTPRRPDDAARRTDDTQRQPTQPDRAREQLDERRDRDDQRFRDDPRLRDDQRRDDPRLRDDPRRDDPRFRDDQRRDEPRARDDRDRDRVRDDRTRDRDDREVVQFGATLQETDRGLRVSRVMEGTLADRAGLEQDDVLVSIAGRRVTSEADIQRMIFTQPPGTRLPMVVIRDGERQTVYYTMTDRRYGPAYRAFDVPPGVPPAFPQDRAWLGVYLSARVPHAAVVESVQVGSAADEAGLEEGDWIVAVNGQRIQSANHLSHMISQMEPGQPVELEIARQTTKSVEARLGERPESPGRFRYDEDRVGTRRERTDDRRLDGAAPRQPQIRDERRIEQYERTERRQDDQRGAPQFSPQPDDRFDDNN